MPSQITIAPRRSVAFFAFLALAMVFVSYVIVILLAATCAYLPYLALTNVRLTNANLLLLFIGGVIMAGALLWSLVPRFEKFTAPGLLLNRSEHPSLFGLLDEVATALKEPLPAEVYLVGEVNAYVSEVGGFMGFGSRRILAVGFPLVAILTVSEFRGVLAHEFGHYYSGDTRMSPWVSRAQAAMARAFQNVGKVGAVGRFAVIQFLYLVVGSILKYHFLFFLKVIRFVSRKKEYRADELACLVAGAEPVLSGIRKIHGGALAWPAYWNTEITPLLNDGWIPPIGAGFARFIVAPKIASQVENGIQTEIAQGKTASYDTHPPLRDRISAIQALKVASTDSDDRPAVSLLVQPETAELDFLRALNPKLNTTLKTTRWEGIENNVTIPGWRSAVHAHPALLQALTSESFPRALKDVSRLSAYVPNPHGMLLSVEQRQQRARQVLTMALGLALVDHGWSLEAQPGKFSFRRSSDELDVSAIVGDVTSGKTSDEAWRIMCEEWGIVGVPFNSSEPAERVTQEGATFAG